MRITAAAMLLLTSVVAQAKVTTGTAVPVAAGITEILVNGETIIGSIRHPVAAKNTLVKKVKKGLGKTPPPPPQPFPVRRP